MKKLLSIILIMILFVPLSFCEEKTDFQKALEKRNEYIEKEGPIEVDSHGVLSFNIQDYYYDENYDALIIKYKTKFKGWYYSHMDRNYIPKTIVFIDEMLTSSGIDVIDKQILQEEKDDKGSRKWTETQTVQVSIPHDKNELFQKEVIISLYRTNGAGLNVLMEKFEKIDINYIPEGKEKDAEKIKDDVEKTIGDLEKEEKKLEKEENRVLDMLKYITILGGAGIGLRKLLQKIRSKKGKVKKSKNNLKEYRDILDSEKTKVKKEKSFIRKIFDDVQTIGKHTNILAKNILKPVNQLDKIKLPVVDFLTVGDLVSLSGAGAVKDILKVKKLTDKLLKLKFSDLQESTIKLVKGELKELYSHKKVKNFTKEYDKAKSLLNGAKEALNTDVKSSMDLIEMGDNFENARKNTKSLKKVLDKSQSQLSKNIVNNIKNL